MRTNIKIIIGIVIAVLISVASSYVLAETVMNSKDVYYEDNSDLGFNNVQDAIDGTCTKFESKVDNFLDKIYPIGSIYISATLSTVDQVREALGGEWEVYGDGRTLVGVGNNGTSNYIAGTTGGSETISYTPGGTIGSTTLTADQIPSHSHTISHTHTTPQTNTTTMSLTAQSSGAHTHAFTNNGSAVGVSMTYGVLDSGTGFVLSSSSTFWKEFRKQDTNIASAGAHTHSVTGSVTVPAMTTNSISTSTSGAAGGGGGHTHSFTGTATTLTTLQPYITVYMYKRTK